MHAFADLTVAPGNIGIHWFEQNSYALKDSTGTITLIDPYFPHERPPEKFIHPEPPLDETELPVNYVVLTHAHLDHANVETCRRLHAAWPDALFICPRDCIDKVLRRAEVDLNRAVSISAGETLVRGGITIHATWSKPPQGDPAAGIRSPDVTHLGYVLETEGVVLYNSGDLINTFADHDELIADVAGFHPQIGFLTTHPTEGEFPYFEGSATMARKIGLRTVVPSHYQCFTARNYDPEAWAAQFKEGDPEPLIIPWNSHILYPGS